MFEENLMAAALQADAELMGYGSPRCGNCRHMLPCKPMPDHGLCRAHQADSMHMAPTRAHELCLRWEPRYGISQDSPVMRVQIRPQELGEASPACEAWLRSIPKPGPAGDLEGW